MQLFSQNTKIEALRRSPLFEGLAKSELTQLAKGTEDVEAAQGKVLCTQEDTAGEFFGSSMEKST